ncbi:hypothetical protein BD779DRAFT_1528545 [Infundibulicybe gibba]|nr:hypothetical protein BD779DRAFT_1528545 [Infundibulicybe gibba]
MDSQPPTPPTESTDIFSLSDQVLSDRLQFIEEIGFGNWGSVWLCRPKSSSTTADGLTKLHDQKIAVKLVHRSKTSTTAARVRSLWNEMKIVRTFKSDPHPSIIPFHSFIITPSYALITMAFLPTLVPVEVEETKARQWFRSLLSGVEFLHKRGVVHNDIKPANILLSAESVPVLVDFGFAEKYDIESSTAFHSNLSYGTPEYLSPERARGLPHDTRKSDVWSLGVTFFEILIGRTPFEYSDGEQFTTKEDLEKYWSRTLRGKWVGTWKMSKSSEKLLRRMVAPNADLRCTASEAMLDAYWVERGSSATAHRRSSSYTSSIVFEKDMAKLLNLSPWKGKEAPDSPPGLQVTKSKDAPSKSKPTISKSKSQPKVGGLKAQPHKRVPPPPLAELSPIPASPPISPLTSTSGKENIVSLNSMTNLSRKPFGTAANRENRPVSVISAKPSANNVRGKRVLADLTGRNRNFDDENVTVNGVKREKGKAKDNHVKDRVREWEREKERLREMEKLEEIARERDEELEAEKQRSIRRRQAQAARERERDKENQTPGASSTFLPTMLPLPPLSPPELKISPSSPDRAGNESGISIFKHSIRKSIGPSCDQMVDIESRRQSWEDEAFSRDAKSSLPVVHQAVRNEQLAADSQIDRMTIWMRNVEKVVEDARETFASSSTLVTPPASRTASYNRSNRSSRLPRKNEQSSFLDQSAASNTLSSAYATVNTTTNPANTTIQSDISAQLSLPQVGTPTRARRATVSTRSPEPAVSSPSPEEAGSPSKRREKSRSHGNLFQMHITPVSMLEAELEQGGLCPTPSPRLSAVLDRSLFIATPPLSRESREEPEMHDISPRHQSFDELTSSPLHVEPYPPRKSCNLEVPESPVQRRLEGVYDRFLMATSGVKRVGKGYQSDNAGPVCSSLNPNLLHQRRDHRAFYSSRRPMPPPVSSDDSRRAVSVDELGVMTYAPATGSPALKDETNTTSGLVRRAIKAMVPGKTTSRRHSRMI